METRARRQSLKAKSQSLPQELWLLILSFVEPKEATRSALVSSEFRKVAGPACQRAVCRIWPQHAHRVAQKLGLGMQRVLNFIQQHEAEATAHPDLQKASSLQKLVLPEHRQIAVEWLIEVAWDWQLESTVVYRGAQYLDHYLAVYPVPALSKFQMLAISSLRTALKHSAKLAERERARLPYKHWAEVTDGACTEAEVRSTCSKLERMLQQQQRSHPNSKQRLRYLWYRLYDAGVVKQEHVYAYMLASFLLHLSLLDSSLSATTPTLLATAALSLALEVFGFTPWPQALQDHSLYVQQELQEVQAKLTNAQEELPAKQLRALWVHSYSYIGTNPAQQPAYSHLQLIVSARGKLHPLQAMLGGVNTSSNSSSSTTEAAPGIAAAAAAVLDNGAAGAAAAAPGLPAAAAAVAAAASGPVDGTVIVGVVPAAAAAAAASGPPAAPVGRVTRAAAAAGNMSTQQRHHLQQRQHQPQATVPRPHGSAAAAASRQAGAAAPNNSSQQQQLGSGDRLLPTPQRTSLTPFASMMSEQAAGPPIMAGLAAANSNAGASSSQQAAAAAVAGSSNGTEAAVGTSSAAGMRRCTRELPARKAVTSSRYGGLASACRVGVSAAGTQGAGSSAEAAGMASAAGSSLAGEGFRVPAVSAAPPPGSTTPSSPKHAAAGHRGLAALFAGARGAAGTSTGAATRSRAAGVEGLTLLHSCRLGSEELERRSLLEGTPQPPQLLALHGQGRHKVVVGAGKHGAAGRGAGFAGAGSSSGEGRLGGLSGSHMLAACEAAASAVMSGPGQAK